jgi:hypothetical protein
MRKQATCAVSRYLVTWNSAMRVGRRTRVQLTSTPSEVTLARGSQFGLSNASNEEAETLVVLLPRKRVWWKKRQTSGTTKVPAMIREPSRLSTASDCRAKIEACEPVRMTGLPRSDIMKESAEAV